MKPYNVKGDNQEIPSLSSELNAAKISIISSALVALGEVTGVFAEILALEELSNADSKDQLGLGSIQKQLDTIQKQLDYLMREVSKKH